MTVFAFGRTVLLMSMRAGHIMSDSNATEEGVEFFILPSPVTLNRNNFPIKVALNKLLKFLEDGKDFRFILKQINPCELAVIINEANIIFFSTKRISSMTPYINEDQL